MTDSKQPHAPDADQIARIAAISASRGRAKAPESAAPNPVAEAIVNSSRAPRKGSRYPALGGRIAAVGIGASGLLGMVAAFGVANATGTASTPPASEEDNPGAQLALDDSAVLPVADEAAEAQAAPTPTPIYLAANPIIRTITIQPPPVIVTVVDPAQAVHPGGLPAGEQAQAAQSQTTLEAAQPGPSPPRQQAGSPAASAEPAPVVISQAPAPAPVVVSQAPAPAPVVVAPAPAPVVVAPAPARVPEPPKSKGSG